MDVKLKNKYDVIVIGGGITGAGTARDCAMRGLSVLLIERFDFAQGATGRNHGLLHSGARYAVTDQESATECIQENMILRKIASHCVDETDGLFITLPEDDLAYQATFVESCQRAGIRADIIDPQEAKILEPAVNPSLIGAVRIPDASIDPFRLTVANVVDARIHGADVITYHEVTELIIDQTRVVGVKMRDQYTGEIREVYADLTINAAGIWGMEIARMAGVIGTTSDRVPIETCDDMRVTDEEVEVLLTEGAQLAPALATTRILRAYAGVRPLVASDHDPSGRSISRGIVTLDHATRDGLEGFVTITGGKMMTYRLMAEMVTDLVCKKLGVNKACETATTPLPGSESKLSEEELRTFSFADKAAEGRHGTYTKEIVKPADELDEALVCECEGVSVAEVNYAVNSQHVTNMIDLRRRTRVGMGTCQGQLCSCRAASLLCQGNHADKAAADLADFIDERWKGMKPVAWGATLNEAQLITMVYEDLCGVNQFVKEGGMK